MYLPIQIVNQRAFLYCLCHIVFYTVKNEAESGVQTHVHTNQSENIYLLTDV